QRPGQHAWVAPLLVSGQGTGKGLFVQTIAMLLKRRHFIHLGSANELTGDFSEHLSHKILVYADEAFWGNKTAAESLKPNITEDTVMIPPKFFPRYEEPSNLHIILASNADRPLPIERDDRRFAVFQVDERHKGDQDYSATLLAERANGGLEAMLFALQR